MMTNDDVAAVFTGCAIGGHTPAGATNRLKLVDAATFVNATPCPDPVEAGVWSAAEVSALKVLAFEAGLVGAGQ